MSGNNAKLTTYTELAEVLEQLPILIRAEQRRRGVSLRQIARECDTSFSTVSRFGNGHDINLSNAVTLLRWLDGAS